MGVTGVGPTQQLTMKDNDLLLQTVKRVSTLRPTHKRVSVRPTSEERRQIPSTKKPMQELKATRASRNADLEKGVSGKFEMVLTATDLSCFLRKYCHKNLNVYSNI